MTSGEARCEAGEEEGPTTTGAPAFHRSWRAKRALDVALTAPALLLLLPVFLGISAAIRIADGSPVFFRQQRIGRYGRHFLMWKFRSMRPPKAAGELLLTVGEDPRITPLGRVIRRLKLDELPQLFNVVAGDMTLVGPRPEVPRYVAHYSPEHARVLELVPGITDPASLAYLDESNLLASAADPERMYVEEIMPAKIRLNLDYASRAGVGSDLKLILLTIWRVAGGRPHMLRTQARPS